MIIYNGVLHGLKYSKPIIKHCNIKDKKIKLQQLLQKQRKLNLQIKKLESYIEHYSYDDKNFPFLL